MTSSSIVSLALRAPRSSDQALEPLSTKEAELQEQLQQSTIACCLAMKQMEKLQEQMLKQGSLFQHDVKTLKTCLKSQENQTRTLKKAIQEVGQALESAKKQPQVETDPLTESGFNLYHLLNSSLLDECAEEQKRQKPNAPVDRRGNTPLHLASSPQETQLIIDAITKDPQSQLSDELNKKNAQGFTPLDLAPNVDAAQLLLSAGAKPSLFSPQNLHVFQFLIERFPLLIHARDKNGKTPLHNQTKAPFAQLLLHSGANPNARDLTQQAPLHTAFNGEIAYSLLAYGAKIDAKNKKGLTPLATAMGNSRIDVAQALLRKGANPGRGHTLFHTLPHTKLCRKLLEGFPNLPHFSRNTQRKTPLICALELLNPQAPDENLLWIIDFFIERGSPKELCLQDSSGYDALHYIMNKGYKPGLIALLEKNIFPECVGQSLLRLMRNSCLFLSSTEPLSIKRTNRGIMPLTLLLKKNK